MGYNYKKIKEAKWLLVNINISDSSYDKKYMTPVSVKCDAIIENELFTWTRSKSSLNASRSIVEPKDICKKAFSMVNESKHVLPILSCQSRARVWMQKREAITRPRRFGKCCSFYGSADKRGDIFGHGCLWIFKLPKRQNAKPGTVGEIYKYDAKE